MTPLNKHRKKDGIEMKNRAHLLVGGRNAPIDHCLSALHNGSPRRAKKRQKRNFLLCAWRGFTKMYRKNFSTSWQGKNFGNL
jgi:hypothetical protein